MSQASDDRRQLQATLETLEAQIRQAKSLDPAIAARLRATLADVEAALAGRAPKSAAGQHSLAERLSHLAHDFEASHPTLSGGVGSIIDALARMGI